MLHSPGSVVRDNQIAAQVYGITVDGGDSVVQGNLIGTDATGSTAVPNDAGVTVTGGDHTLIGGSGAGQGNRIGTDAAGTAALPNDALILGEAAINVYAGKARIGGAPRQAPTSSPGTPPTGS
jgi:hypothetical protein